jgi:hypothetical protein
MPEQRMTCIYALGFSNGVVKVGRTTNLVARYRQHRFWASTHGMRITSRYGYPATDTNPLEHERRLIEFCAERWQRARGREYFADADFPAICAFMFRLEDEEINARRVAVGLPAWEPLT